jgi:serine kinase of HPr protein (carbohydrate metabolism regulator)
VITRQATCVAIGGRALLIEGEPGCGKSGLALALIDRGATLIGDDGIQLELRNGNVWALPPPNIAGLLEVRNVGLIELPTTSARLALALRLDQDAARLPERADTLELLGCTVPLLPVWPGSPVLALRAEHALRLHGLA